VELIVTKTIELMETEYVRLHHDRLCEKIRKEIEEEQQKKNIVTDSTATIIYENGYDEGYAACVREIEEKLSKDNTISFDSWKQGWEDGCREFARLLKEKMAEFSDNIERGNVNMMIDTLLKEMTEKKEVTKNDNKHKIIS
jgi:hypothetical protein